MLNLPKPPSIRDTKVSLQWDLPRSFATFDNTKPLLRMNTRWLLPPLGYYKINVYGVARHSQGLATTGGVLRSHFGDIVVAYIGNLNGCTNNQAEGMALARGLQIAPLLACVSLSLKVIPNLLSILSKG